jgi:hypothetical protein
VFFGGLYYVLEHYRKWQFLLPLFATIILFGTLTHTFLKLERHIPVLQRNLRNDPLYGYTPDWRNFILMSEWAAKNVPRSAVIASRKPSISCIHGSRDFVGISSVPAINNDELKNLTPQPLKKFLMVDISAGWLPVLSPHMQYVAFGKQPLNGKEVSAVAIYEIDDTGMPQLLPALKENNLNFTFDYVPVFTHITTHSDILCYSPDNLYNSLRERNIQYMLMASLRMNPATNTGNIINTLQRYIYIVSLKYPDIVKRQCHSIGDSEPATLLELQY